ncbi:hypothetical protein BATDEDRAFT_90272 [Batrachochytrium dendrobatidis JAM81]|uniref:Uncharacterized protein n=1 Tax=Batrachochytrium dendrobatidis (strain JAM81 / FGSC 10211) TaxID=684364 RepID=F4P6M6_BATDJ|nr:uncharacterized protein BATDEDRAFT_90272 [Batrachochytrium dendrobatidis JAM81]EGF78820.1 hypothetical protein BATDEDRAFT_90272 [Batrachochytrium dendrobatidis JAM81]|eukprot:XP_006680468.1 hypothetical protein BATDEDRAFT_90272 [Batrachochytrium dendrobatidis JAM81]
MDGVETNYNAWDSLAALETNGTVGSSPLIIKSHSGTGQGVASSVSGASVGVNIRLVSGELEETTNPSLSNYCHIADSLKNDNCVVQIVNTLLSVTAGELSESNFTNLPFTFPEGSSGSGKSQMGFNIKANIGNERRVHYFLFDPPSSTSQDIYRNFQNTSKLFSKCYVADEHMYSSEASSPSCGSLFKESLYIYGFIFELLSDKTQSSRINTDLSQWISWKVISFQTSLSVFESILIVDD